MGTGTGIMMAGLSIVTAPSGGITDIATVTAITGIATQADSYYPPYPAYGYAVPAPVVQIVTPVR